MNAQAFSLLRYQALHNLMQGAWMAGASPFLTFGAAETLPQALPDWRKTQASRVRVVMARHALTCRLFV